MTTIPFRDRQVLDSAIANPRNKPLLPMALIVSGVVCLAYCALNLPRSVALMEELFLSGVPVEFLWHIYGISLPLLFGGIVCFIAGIGLKVRGPLFLVLLQHPERIGRVHLKELTVHYGGTSVPHYSTILTTSFGRKAEVHFPNMLEAQHFAAEVKSLAPAAALGV